MRQAFSLTQQDVANIREWIGKAQKKQRVKLQSYNNSINGLIPNYLKKFTSSLLFIIIYILGQQLSDILQPTFGLSKEEAIQMGSLLLQCNIIKRLNFRHSPNFSTASNCMYQLEVKSPGNQKMISFFIKNHLQDPSKEFPIWLHTNNDEKEDSPKEVHKERNGTDSNPSITGKRVENVAGGLPGIGNAFEVVDVRNTHRSMQILGRDLCPKYRDMGLFRINLMGHEYIVASNPHHVQAIFENPKIGKKTKSDAIFKELRKFRFFYFSPLII